MTEPAADQRVADLQTKRAGGDAAHSTNCWIEQAAKALPVHVNTLRYRLDRIAELTGFDLRDSRGAFAIFTGVSLGRMRDATGATPIDL
jgi:hypothetical protein